MYVICYCQIFVFHPALNLKKIVIFWSFQQNFEEINSLGHFSQDHVQFFDPITVKQMRDSGALSVLWKEKTTSLSEFFVLELKFTIDTLVKWLNSTFKQKFLELSDLGKRTFTEENPIDFLRTIRSICGFMLSFSAREGPERTLNLETWYNFIVQQEYLF